MRTIRNAAIGMKANRITIALARKISGVGTGFTCPSSSYVRPVLVITPAPIYGPLTIGIRTEKKIRMPCNCPALDSGV